jgi:hypothetical protein
VLGNDLKEEPRTALRLIDEIFEKAGRHDVVEFIAYVVCGTANGHLPHSFHCMLVPPNGAKYQQTYQQKLSVERFDS